MTIEPRIVLSTESLKDTLWNSQRCQRNWDLNKEVPTTDIEIMLHSIKSSPSKQNEKHFKVYVISNYDLRKRIYDNTNNFAHDADGESICFNPDGSINYKHQSQLIGNLLFVFCRDVNNVYRSGESYAGSEFVEQDMNVLYAGTIDLSTPDKKRKTQDKYNNAGLHAIGISVGYLLVTAHMLGYKTGCSSGFSKETVSEITGNKFPEIVVAVGFADPTRDSREEHFETHRLFPSFDKEITVEWII
jgi:nitroreductase